MRSNFIFRQVKETVMTMETITTIVTESLLEYDKAGICHLKDYNRQISVKENNVDIAGFGRAA